MVHKVAKLLSLDDLVRLDTDAHLRPLDRVKAHSNSIAHSQIIRDNFGDVLDQDLLHKALKRDLNAEQDFIK